MSIWLRASHLSQANNDFPKLLLFSCLVIYTHISSPVYIKQHSSQNIRYYCIIYLGQFHLFFFLQERDAYFIIFAIGIFFFVQTKCVCIAAVVENYKRTAPYRLHCTFLNKWAIANEQNLHYKIFLRAVFSSASFLR